MSNGNGNGKAGIWTVVIAVLSALGISGASVIALNREVSAACQRAERNERDIAMLEGRGASIANDIGEIKGDIKAIKVALERDKK